MSVVVYSAIYGDFDPLRPQAVPVRLFTDATHPLPHEEPRRAAKWWRARPDLACPDAEVTVWIDGSITVMDEAFPEIAAAALGDADILLDRHPLRDDIYEEAEISVHMGKYDGQPIREQVAAYRAAGHPEHWGLMQTGVLVRRQNERTRALGEAWWAEMSRWSLQDQISLPFLLRTLDIRVAWWERSPFEGLLRLHPHRFPDVWHAEAA